MRRSSLHLKLGGMLLLLIILVLLVACAFLVRGVQAFYLDAFYSQMRQAFSNVDFVSELQAAARLEDGYQKIESALGHYAGTLGIDGITRNYYVLEGKTGQVLAPADALETELEATLNILRAIGGEIGDSSDTTASFMDVALPIGDGDGQYIVYIRDNKQTVLDLSSQLFQIIINTAVISLLISVFLSFLLSKAVVSPIQSLTRASERVAAGDFSKAIENPAHDELGELAKTFNNMAGQLQETVKKLERSAQLQREFVANVSHELRTPLTSIRSYSETLMDGGLPEEMRGELLQVVVDESDRMTRIVQDLLVLSKLDGETVPPKLERFSFVEAVRGIVRSLEPEIRKKSLTVIDQLAPHPDIRGDKPGIERIITNILSNAVKYTGTGGRITLNSRSESGKLYLEVEDNGIGIPPADMARIFDRFYRVESGRSREFGGTGLGLAIARETARRFGGDVLLESKEGWGTRAIVTLPQEAVYGESS